MNENILKIACNNLYSVLDFFEKYLSLYEMNNESNINKIEFYLKKMKDKGSIDFKDFLSEIEDEELKEKMSFLFDDKKFGYINSRNFPEDMNEDQIFVWENYKEIIENI